MAKVCKKMHKHVFDGENIDLSQVMKNLYENFTLIFKATILEHEKFGRQVLEDLRYKFLSLRKELGFLISFPRCMLKRCVEEDTGVINRSLVDILTDIESHFVDHYERCSTLLSRESISTSEDREVLRMGSVECLVSRISNAYLDAVCCSTDHSSPSSTGFLHSSESMVELLDQLQEDLDQCFMEDKIEKTFTEMLEFMRNCLRLTKEYSVSGEGLKDLLISFEVVAESMACYIFLKEYDKDKMYLQIENRFDSEMGIAVLRALPVMKLQKCTGHLLPFTDGLMNGYVDCVGNIMTKVTIHKDDESIIYQMMLLVKNQFDDLHKELEKLVCLILNCPPKSEAELEKLSDIQRQFQNLLLNLGTDAFLYLKEKETSRDMATEISTPVMSDDLLQKIHLVKERITQTFVHLTLNKIGQSSPKTDPLGFLNSLISNMESNEYLRSGGFRSIHEDLVLLQSFLQNMTMRNGSEEGDDDESQDLLTYRIRCALYGADLFITSYVTGFIPDSCRSGWLSSLKQLIELVKATFADITEKKSAIDLKNIDINVARSSKNLSRVSLLPASTDVVVGFKDEMESIKERLISDSSKLDVVSIFGMGGLGKTTLAKKVYDDPSIVDHFQFRAWSCVSQEYDKKELLLEILDSVTKLTALDRTKSEGDLSVMLYKQLMGSRYLIVMDDVWEMDAFKDLKRFFPDSSNGSRIMLTSRKRLKDYINPLELRLLTIEQSWNLLKQKLYHKTEEVPLELCEVGTEIAEKCSGLPLAIVVVAGILAKSEKKRDFWEQVARNLSSYIAGDATTHGQVTAALELSYEHLPGHLKPLFLYLGAFPEDREIPSNKLMWMWIAEGFIHKADNYQVSVSLELQAERNLLDLIDRSLVMIAERRSDGRIKSCRVHDMLRDMCLRKAKDENFMRHTTLGDCSPDPVTYERRLSIFLNRSYQSGLTVTCKGLPMLSFPPPLSSFFFFSTTKTLPESVNDDMKSVFRGFKLLRILHFESLTVNEDLFRDYIVKLVLLRYISIRTYWRLIPLSISCLRNLETLIIKGLRGEIVVPREILNMVRLRHLHVNDRADFNSALTESSSKLENLETLSTPAVSYEEEEKLIQRVPNLRKLRCILVEARNFSKKYYQLPQLDSLNQLVSLKMLCHGRMPHSGEFSLPSTLKKLTLSKFRLQWSEISSFQKLPNLEVLKLHVGSVEGALWDTGDGEFPKLKYLELETLNIKKWIVSAVNFPCLKTLVFQSCKQLEEIPSSVGDFYSLEKIEVVRCCASAAKSAKIIQEEQKDMGNELLRVQVSMSS